MSCIYGAPILDVSRLWRVVVCDLETSRIGAQYIYNISCLRVKHVANSPFFSSKCRLFHNSTFFGSCIIHILYTGVLKFKCKTPVPKG